MSATAQLKCLPPTVIAILSADPGLIEPFVCAYPPSAPPDLPEEMHEAYLQNPSILENIQAMREWLEEEAGDAAELLLAESSGPHLDLDKTWETLENNLDQIPSSLALKSCIFGGREIGPDLGYGPARLLDPEEVSALALALDRVDPAQVEAGFLRELFEQLRVYYRQAAERGLGMLQSLA